MNDRGKRIKTPLAAIIYLLFICLLLPAYYSYAIQSIYTIQAGSYKSVSDAQKQFNFIVRMLNENDLQYLRIEKVGKFYTVRIGKFNGHSSADKFLRANKPALSTAIIMDAYYKDERIKQLYNSIQSEEKHASIENLSFDTGPETIKPETTEHDVRGNEKDIIPETLEGQIEKIAALVNEQNYETALRIVKSALSLRPNEPQLLGWHGTVLVKMNHPDKAISYFRKASALSPAVPDYHSGLGYCLYFLGRFDEAIDEFRKTLTLDPVHIDALAGLGAAYKQAGEKDKAMVVYNELMGINKDIAYKILKIIDQ